MNQTTETTANWTPEQLASIRLNSYTVRNCIADLETALGAAAAYPATSLLLQARERLEEMGRR